MRRLSAMLLLVLASAALAIQPGAVKQFHLTNTKTQSFKTEFESTSPGHFWGFIRPDFVTPDELFPLYLQIATPNGTRNTRYLLTLRDATANQPVFEQLSTSTGTNAHLRLKVWCNPHHVFTLKIECPASTPYKTWLGQTRYNPQVWVYCGVYSRGTLVDREFNADY